MFLDLFKVIIFILQVSMTVTIYITIPVLLLFRIFIVYRNRKSFKENILTIILPLSIGYFIYHDEDNNLSKWYKRLLITCMIIAILGMLYTFYLSFL